MSWETGDDKADLANLRARPHEFGLDGADPPGGLDERLPVAQVLARLHLQLRLQLGLALPRLPQHRREVCVLGGLRAGHPGLMLRIL